jgi:Histidyl-tRNA synthetase
MQQLRDSGYRVDYSLATAKIARQFRLAEQTGARFVDRLGGRMAAGGVKDLTSGKQESSPMTKCLRIWNRFARPPEGVL